MTHDNQHDSYYDYYEKLANWSFDEFGIHSESLTDWDLYDILRSLVTRDSRVLDLGTGGGEKLLLEYPECEEILGTDYSPAMIATARRNLEACGRTDVAFEVMDNLNMNVPDDHFDVVVARHTITDPAQIIKCLKPGGHLLIRGVDKYDCWSLKMLFGGGQGWDDPAPVSITDYENVLRAGFKDVDLVPIHEWDFFKSREQFRAFLAKVPILDGMQDRIDDKLLDEYIEKNTFGGRIKLLRMYYGITARK
ncbi:Methyltransferase domain-containing protein [Ruminococcaceae bacterium YRB3002]|nr:Methyltransferase domain-containing protein [Ruminococcaceae bacterium YRB3002]